ncbi:thiamine pyrophosphate-binding protein [Lapidilactobacillus luobeiensis]|uniref:thiamine pyrophosphate-binding protein n=1 Tax=Lapidilactobacillus luobeiensis TaxID=2950371 RepID=UPI0021C39F49|nr:thiamine pyrophosphate-binding protein [Lapidilactobacillus luobeiensis]
MGKYYSSEKNVQMLIALMKASNVRKVVVSPGATNVCFVGSIQNDSYFTLYSCVDERSAAYMACGLAAESGEPVALSCTGATASRNYYPALTEAYYRGLPVLAITSSQHSGRIGSYTPQVTDRVVLPNDVVVCSVQAEIPVTSEDEWAVNVSLNRALIALRKNGGGPVHINLITGYSKDFSIKTLPSTRVIRHIGYHNALPKLKKGRVGVYVGAHEKWNESLTSAINSFCKAYGAVVLCDHASNYKGEFKVEPSLVCSQTQYDSPCRTMDVMIYIGYVTGAQMGMKPNEVWRVNPDGIIRDHMHKTTYVFQMEEEDFFKAYERMGRNTVEEGSTTTVMLEQLDGIEPDNENGLSINNDKTPTLQETYLEQWQRECNHIAKKVPELPFSNAWLAQQTSSKLPEGSVLHLGILNSLRTWNLFEIPDNVCSYSNTGGFGIDGDVSSLLGASLAHPNTLYFGVVGDLAFFYDMNVLGNRFFGKNVRLLLVNNGRGTEFRNYMHLAARFGEDADPYMAAAGHFGRQSRELVKHYAQDLGFEYMTASGKDEYLMNLPRFLTNQITDKPMLFEVFTDSANESQVLEILYNLEVNTKGAAKHAVKRIIGEKGVTALKSIIKR